MEVCHQPRVRNLWERTLLGLKMLLMGSPRQVAYHSLCSIEECNNTPHAWPSISCRLPLTCEVEVHVVYAGLKPNMAGEKYLSAEPANTGTAPETSWVSKAIVSIDLSKLHIFHEAVRIIFCAVACSA